MIRFTDQKGNQLLALAEVTFKFAVNGEKSLTGTIYTNDEVINNIDRGWTMEFNDEKYYITYAKPTDTKEQVTVEFDAIHEFFYKMGKSAVYSELSDGSHTVDEYLHFIFDGSEYYFQLGTAIGAFEKQSFGMKNRMALFNDFIDSTGLEYQLSGHTVTIKDKIGSDLSTIVRKGFNMQELTLEYNISDFVTYAKGFGAYHNDDDHSQGRVESEYRSPLADIYGVLEADPVSDERYTIVENLTEKLKQLVESSYSISVAMSLEDLQKAGYEYALPNPGDYILGVDEELGFSQKIRIVSTETKYDIEGNKLDTAVTLNSLSAVDSKIQSDASTSKTMNDIINGNSSIPNTWLEDATQIATEALQDTQTELKFTSNGILAIDKTNANNVVIFNSAGIGVSTNGGKTFDNAMTGKGINATAITTGILRAVDIIGVNISGSTLSGSDIIGSKITSPSPNSQAKLVIEGSTENFYSINGTQVGGIAPSYDGSSGQPNGLFIFQPANQTFSVNTGYSFGRTFPIIQIPADSSENQRTVNVWGNFNVVNGSKNAVHPTRDGFRATPAYETAESYLGDIGENITDDMGKLEINIETLFGDTINTDYAYQVFLSSYADSNVWVAERGKESFTVKSDKPNVGFAWELKGKRRGYEVERLVDIELTYQEAEKMYEERSNNDETTD